MFLIVYAIKQLNDISIPLFNEIKLLKQMEDTLISILDITWLTSNILSLQSFI